MRRLGPLILDKISLNTAVNLEAAILILHCVPQRQICTKNYGVNYKIIDAIAAATRDVTTLHCSWQNVSVIVRNESRSLLLANVKVIGPCSNREEDANGRGCISVPIR